QGDIQSHVAVSLRYQLERHGAVGAQRWVDSKDAHAYVRGIAHNNHLKCPVLLDMCVFKPRAP
ncbi:MAG: hypothetical protein ACK55Z_22605, partial [bacterium]